MLMDAEHQQHRLMARLIEADRIRRFRERSKARLEAYNRARDSARLEVKGDMLALPKAFVDEVLSSAGEAFAHKIATALDGEIPYPAIRMAALAIWREMQGPGGYFQTDGLARYIARRVVQGGEIVVDVQFPAMTIRQIGPLKDLKFYEKMKGE